VALAAASGFALGEGKERLLILPCPTQMSELRLMIEAHDIVVLMKIGQRLPSVLTLLCELGIAEWCVFGSHVGMADAILCTDLSTLDPVQSRGYLSTLLIRKSRPDKRHLGAEG